MIDSMKGKKQGAAEMEQTVILGKLSKIGLNSQILESGWLRAPLNVSNDVIGHGGQWVYGFWSTLAPLPFSWLLNSLSFDNFLGWTSRTSRITMLFVLGLNPPRLETCFANQVFAGLCKPMKLLFGHYLIPTSLSHFTDGETESHHLQ